MENTKGSIPSLPVEDILVSVANSVVKAQHALDSQSLESEVRIREAELDTQFGLSANWYTIPELDFELRLAFEVGNRGEVTTQMVDAEYQSKYGFNVKASSLLNTKIVATPPAEGSGLSLLDEKQVLQEAGRIKVIVEAYDRAETPYFTVRYQPFSRTGYAGGLWYVLLMDTLLSGKNILRALATIDDTRGEIVRIWSDIPVVVDGVSFTPEQALYALVLINVASEDVLRGEIDIYSQAVTGILEHRPFNNLVALSEIDGMGHSSMQKLYDYVFNEQQSGEGEA